MPRALTNRQKAFVTEYLSCWNASEAARRAGYSARSAKKLGWETLTHPLVRAEIDRVLKDRAMSAAEILARLTSQARGDLADFVRPIGEGADSELLIDLRHAHEAGKLHLVRKITSTTTEQRGVTTRKVEIELYDAQAALVILGKHHRLWIDRQEVADWRAEVEAAGADPDHLLEDLTDEFVRHLTEGQKRADVGSAEEGEGPADPARQG